MAPKTAVALGPRKTPAQARSAVRWEAISEATIQVLASLMWKDEISLLVLREE